jgi:hypothetical protein
VSAYMVRRRSTVRFRNGAPQDLACEARSEAHWTALILRCGWELLPYWEESGRSCPPGPTEQARSGPREGQPGGTAGLRDGKPEACGPVASRMRFQPGAARWPYGHEMITLLEHIGEPWQRKPRPCIPSRLTGRIIMASLYGFGEGSRLASIAPI